MSWLKDVVALIAIAATPAVAQQARHAELTIPTDQPFKHRLSGVTLPRALAGLPRARIREYLAPQLDLVATYATGDGEELSVFVYHAGAGVAAIWFDRAEAAIVMRPAFGKLERALPAEPLRIRTSAPATGLITAWSTTGTALTGTGLAMVPVGPWLVKLRYSSTTQRGEAIAVRLQQAVAELRWPKAATKAPLAVPVTPCAEPLRFDGESRDLAETPAALLMTTFLLTAAPGKKTDQPTGLWCRDPAVAEFGAIYRPDGATDRYLYAYSDAGRGAEVGPSIGLTLEPNAEPSWTVSETTPGQVQVFTAQDRLPTPARLMAIVRGPVRSTVRNAGKSEIMLPTDFGKN